MNNFLQIITKCVLHINKVVRFRILVDLVMSVKLIIVNEITYVSMWADL